jgi:hypothetical protein
VVGQHLRGAVEPERAHEVAPGAGADHPEHQVVAPSRARRRVDHAVDDLVDGAVAADGDQVAPAGVDGLAGQLGRVAGRSVSTTSCSTPRACRAPAAAAAPGCAHHPRPGWRSAGGDRTGGSRQGSSGSSVGRAPPTAPRSRRPGARRSGRAMLVPSSRRRPATGPAQASTMPRRRASTPAWAAVATPGDPTERSWPSRSAICFTARTKSPPVSSRPPSASSRSAPDAHRQAGPTNPASSSPSWRSPAARSRSRSSAARSVTASTASSIATSAARPPRRGRRRGARRGTGPRARRARRRRGRRAGHAAAPPRPAGRSRCRSRRAAGPRRSAPASRRGSRGSRRTPRIRCRWRTSEPVARSIAAWSRSASSSSSSARYCQRSCSARSGQAWHGWARSSARSRSIVSDRPGAPPPRRRRGRPGHATAGPIRAGRPPPRGGTPSASGCPAAAAAPARPGRGPVELARTDLGQRPVVGDDLRDRGALAGEVDADDGDQPAAASPRQVQDVAGRERGDALAHPVAGRVPAGLGLRLLRARQLAAQRPVGGPVPQLAPQVAGVAGEPLVQLGEPVDLALDGGVGLVLGERGTEQRLGLGQVVPAQQVDGHVVRRRERAVQRVRTRADQPGDGREVEVALVEHDRVADPVDPRRPARPVSWVYSPGVSRTCDSPFHFSSRSITTVRAGMLMPSARVSVATTTLSSPRWNRTSTHSLNAGTMPAWWAAMPSSSPPASGRSRAPAGRPPGGRPRACRRAPRSPCAPRGWSGGPRRAAAARPPPRSPAGRRRTRSRAATAGRRAPRRRAAGSATAAARRGHPAALAAHAVALPRPAFEHDDVGVRDPGEGLRARSRCSRLAPPLRPARKVS